MSDCIKQLEAEFTASLRRATLSEMDGQHPSTGRVHLVPSESAFFPDEIPQSQDVLRCKTALLKIESGSPLRITGLRWCAAAIANPHYHFDWDA